LKATIPLFNVEPINLLSHPKLKKIQIYLENHHRMAKDNKFLIQDVNLINDFLKQGYVVDTLAYCEQMLLFPKIEELAEYLLKIPKQSMVHISEEVAILLSRSDNILTTDRSYEITALFDRPENGQLKKNSSRIVICDKISDPVNLGILLSSAVSFGVDTIVLIKGSCDIWSPKVIQVCQGAHLHIEIVEYESWETAIEALKQHNVRLVAACESGSLDYTKVRVKKAERVGLIIGNESLGLSPIIQELVTQNNIEGVKIPVKNSLIASLNAGIAGSIIMSKIF